MLSYQLAPGTSLSESNRVGDELERQLLEMPAVKAVFRRTGSPESSFYTEGPDQGELVIRLDKLKAADPLALKADFDHLLSETPGVIGRVNEPTTEKLDESFSGLPALFGITLYGDDLQQLYAAAARVEAAADKVAGLANVINNSKVPVDQIRVAIDRTALARFGVSVQWLAQAVRTAMQGERISQVIIDQQPADAMSVVPVHRLTGSGDWVVRKGVGKRMSSNALVGDERNMEKACWSVMGRLWLAVSLWTVVTSAAMAENWVRVNECRQAAGLPPLTSQAELTLAARRHAAYLSANRDHVLEEGLSPHQEETGRAGFSGAGPADRVRAAGYPHGDVKENVTLGSPSMAQAIDGLMTAIYHRLGFLDWKVDEIGAGQADQAHVFDMGRGDLRRLCENPPTEALASPPVDCAGTRVTQDFLRGLCADLPPAAYFHGPWRASCVGDRRLDAGYMEDFCAAPPSEALARSGSYYQPCGEGVRIDATWFEGFCADLPAAARYGHSGHYYRPCGDQVQVDAEWFQARCAEAGPGQRYTDSGAYRLLCTKPVKLRIEYLDGLDERRLADLPRWVSWPPDGAGDVPPVFTEEDPDPLPDYSLSGNPLSIQFNPARVSQVRLRNFQLFVADGEGWKMVQNVRLMDADNDPNDELDDHQFALFPLARLAWGHRYQARLEAVLDGNLESIQWTFSTQEPLGELLSVGPQAESLLLDSGRLYTLYFQRPAGSAPVARHIAYQYARGAVPEFHIVDGDTLEVRLEAHSCQPVSLRLDGSRALHLRPRGC